MQYLLFNMLRHASTSPQCGFTQSFRSGSNFLYKRARAGENIHFLKIQREQLMKLRTKLIRQKENVLSNINRVDEQIQSITAKADEKKRTN